MLCYNKSLHYISPRYAYTETKFISQEEYCNKISVLGSIGKRELNVARDVCLGVKLTQTKRVTINIEVRENNSYKIFCLYLN